MLLLMHDSLTVSVGPQVPITERGSKMNPTSCLER